MADRIAYEQGIRWAVRGAQARPFQDVFHRLMQMHWGTVIALAAAAYLLSALVFALAFWALPGSIHGGDDSFVVAYWFSIQTLSTIGYGTLSPIGWWSNLLVTVESFVGLAGVAVITALLYAKFSKPSARVDFSDVALIHERDGQPTLHIRLANERTTPILDARLHLGILVDETERHGHSFRRMYDLELVRDRIPMFAMTFTAMHVIDQDSPLYGLPPDQIVFMILTFSGTDDVLMQPVFGRHVYQTDDFRLGCRFGNAVDTGPDGSLILDVARLHDFVELGDEEPQEQEETA